MDAGGAADQQYEAICYSSDGREIVTVTEKAGSSDIPLYTSQAAPGAATSTISGTPSAAGISSFTIQAKDSANNIATRRFDLSIAE